MSLMNFSEISPFFKEAGGFLIGLLTGILSGFGIGGGSLLIIYLTNLTSINQYAAGGINLLYFLFCAPGALISHIKNKLIDKKAVCFCILSGIPVCILCSFLAYNIDVSLLRRFFGVLLLYVGFKELFSKSKDVEKEKGS